ncbi:MAG: oligosaccharide flippase family protein, partial [Veillonella sp.]|nr:oligosaccharide flippase family protein [Veillonella sp.]
MASGFLKGTLILTIAGFVVKAIGSINWILLSRILGGEGIGIYQMAFPIYLLLLQISSAGVPIAISILTAERLALHDFGGAKRVFNISFTMLTITGFIASLAMYFGADWLISSGLIAE